MSNEGVLPSAMQRELEKKIHKLEKSTDRLWQRFGQICGIYLAGLALVMGLAKPYKLRCSEAWMGDVLICFVSSAHLIIFHKLVQSLQKKHEKLKEMKTELKRLTQAAPLEENAGAAGGVWIYRARAILAISYLILVIAVLCAISHKLPCTKPKRPNHHRLLAT